MISCSSPYVRISRHKLAGNVPPLISYFINCSFRAGAARVPQPQTTDRISQSGHTGTSPAYLRLNFASNVLYCNYITHSTRLQGKNAAARKRPATGTGVLTHAPLRGAQPYGITDQTYDYVVSTHAPLRGATDLASAVGGDARVSTHAPLRGATMR